jgi:putative DNA methylase
LRRLAGADAAPFAAESTHRPGDLTGNETLERGLEEFAEGLSGVFCRFARALVPGGPFVFTYHHNDLTAYLPVVVALLDAGLVCTATLPCPAEMGGSIHIHKSGSSILDSVFVCRTEGAVSRRMVEAATAAEVAALVDDDLSRLREADVPVTHGDARCLTFGHLARLAVWRLRTFWNRHATWSRKSVVVAAALADLPRWEEVRPLLEEEPGLGCRSAARAVREPPGRVGDEPGSEWIAFQPPRTSTRR